MERTPHLLRLLTTVRNNHKLQVLLIWSFIACGLTFGKLPIFAAYAGILASFGITAFCMTALLCIQIKRQLYQHFIILALGIACSSLIIETIGVQTTFPFGSYYYTSALQPQIMGVPCIIGLAWLLIVVLAVGLTNRITDNPLRLILGASVILVFDLALEPAAAKLNFWQFNGPPPLQNYLSWIAIGTTYTWLMIRLLPGLRVNESICLHVYLSQLCYFFGSALL